MIRKKTKKQKKQDQKYIAKKQKKLQNKVTDFERNLWECEFDASFLSVYVYRDLFRANNRLTYAQNVAKQTHIYDTYEEIKDIESSHMTHSRQYK